MKSLPRFLTCDIALSVLLLLLLAVEPVAVDRGGSPPLGETFPDVPEEESLLCPESLPKRLLPDKVADFPESLLRRLDEDAAVLEGREEVEVDDPKL